MPVDLNVSKQAPWLDMNYMAKGKVNIVEYEYADNVFSAVGNGLVSTTSVAFINNVRV